MSIKLLLEAAENKINDATPEKSLDLQAYNIRCAMRDMLAVLVLMSSKKAGAIDADGAREMLRESRLLSSRALRALKAADVALTTVLAWERTYYAPEEKAAMRDVEIARRKIRRLMKPGQFVEDESAAGDDGADKDARIKELETMLSEARDIVHKYPAPYAPAWIALSNALGLDYSEQIGGDE